MPKPNKPNKGNGGNYVVKAGDNYAKLAEQFLGDQRGYGEFLRLNGNQPLQPGDVIKIPKRRKDYFVSGRDVAFAQNSTNANYTGPQMQQYSDYTQNYKAAQAAGFGGVGYSPFQGTGQNAGVQGAAPGAAGTGPQGVNWNTPLNMTSGPAATIGNTGQNYSQLAAGGQAGYQATQVQQAQNTASLNAAAGVSGNPAQGAQLPKTTAQQANQPRGGQPGTYDAKGMTAQGKGVAGIPSATATPATSDPLASLHAWEQSKGVSPEQQAQTASLAVSQAQNQQNVVFATNAATSVMTNKNVPVQFNVEQTKAVLALAAADPKLMMRLSELYDPGPDGALVPKGSTWMPGTQTAMNFNVNPYPAPYSSAYSNTPPQGYNSKSNFYSNSGRRSAAPDAPPDFYASQNFSVNIGQ